MRRMTLDDARELLAAGIPIEAITAVCPVPTRIRRTGRMGQRYEPDPVGGRAHVFPATVIDPGLRDLIEADGPREIVSTGSIVDLVAVDIKAPGRWALRTGAAVVLGAIEQQWGFADPVPIHR